MEKWTKTSLVSHSRPYVVCDYIDNFPSAPDRTGKISKFNFDAYAVLEATQSQGEDMLDFCRGHRLTVCLLQSHRTRYWNPRSNAGFHALSSRRSLPGCSMHQAILLPLFRLQTPYLERAPVSVPLAPRSACSLARLARLPAMGRQYSSAFALPALQTNRATSLLRFKRTYRSAANARLSTHIAWLIGLAECIWQRYSMPCVRSGS